MTGDLIKHLLEIKGGDLPLVGAKAFNLALLKQQGFPTPQGFVLTTLFFEDYLARSHLSPLWHGHPGDEGGALPALAEALLTTPLPANLLAALLAGLEDLLPGHSLFAVRSSAPDEDVTGRTFAGLHLSRLNLDGSEIEEAVRACWASAFSAAALAYRREIGLSLSRIPMAVLVQEMVKADVAGVAFTVGPLDESRDSVVVEAVSGCGGALTGGRVTPQRYRLSRNVLLGPLVKEAPAVESLLDGEKLRTLRELLLRIEALLGEPQDVEWGLVGPVFYVLQSRPVIPASPASATVEAEWARVRFEGLPDLPSPLMASFLGRSWPGLASLVKEVGVDVSPGQSAIKAIYGRPYVSLSLLGRIAASLGLSREKLLWAWEGLMEGGGRPAAPASAVSPGPLALWRWWKGGRKAGAWLRSCKEALEEIAARLEHGRMADEAQAEYSLDRFRLPENFYGAWLACKLAWAGAIAVHLATARQVLEPCGSEREELANLLLSEELRSGATSPEQVWARLRDCPPGWRRFLLRRCLESLRELGRLGEEIRALELSGGGAMRAWELALGRRWAEAGWLEQADDIFWLTAAEVERGLVSAAARNTLPVTVRARKAEYEEYRQLEMPGLLREGEMARLHPQMQREMLAEGGVLIGVPVNPGMAQGPVLVICGSQDFVKMKKGAIIVAPVADSSWVSLFPSAAGLIVETGGLLSHGATLAREYRLPMISAVAGATKRLRDGDQVLLDGSTGVVQVLAAAGGISTEEVQDEPS